MLALLCLLAASPGLAPAAAAATREPPSFVVIQTDDQTLDELYASFGQPKLQAMPNTLDLIAKRGETFNRYYVSYPLCCPSRVSLLTGRYAHNNGVKGNIQPNGGYFGFSFRAAYTHNLATWLQGAGYRTIHVGKFLNGYGDEPYDNGTDGAARLERLAHGAESRHRPLLLRLHAQQQRRDRRPLRRLGQLGTARIRRARRHRLPLRPAQRPALLLRDRHADQLAIAAKSCRQRRPNSPSTCSSTTPPRTATSASPAGPEPAPRHYDWFKGAPLPTTARKGFDEGNVTDKPRFIRDAPYLASSDIHTYRVYYDKALESLRSIDDGVKLLSTRSARCTGCATPTSSSPPTTASSSASTA